MFLNRYLKNISKVAAVILILSMFLACLVSCGSGSSNGDSSGEPVAESGYSPIKSVKAIGFVDRDGAKVKAIVAEYEEDLSGVAVKASDYTVSVYDSKKYWSIGNGKVGDITAIYVNEEAEISENGGTGQGRYVVMELFTDYLNATELSFSSSMVVRVTQVSEFTLKDGRKLPAGDTDTNNLLKIENTTAAGEVYYSYKLDPAGFEIADIEGFKWYTDNPGDYGADGPAFEVKNCFNQQDGLYYDEHLAYALYLPEDYSESGTYAMVTLDNPATNVGTHPIVSTLATRSPAVYASEWAQELVKKEHGVDGLIVVVPVITERVNDNGGTPAEYEALVALWDYIIETYHVDENYVYGSGQSVGGMELLETNRNRDNFFAGLMLYEDQWAQNYYVDTLFVRDMAADANAAATATMHYPRADADITWNYSLDTNGGKIYEGHDPYNYYYLVSDDNILISSGDDVYLSIDTWTEMKYLYKDLAGYDLERLDLDGGAALETQNAILEEYFSRENALNINWCVYSDSVGGYTDRRPDATYEWLLSQSRQTEIAREKLDLNKPFETADTQIKTEDRKLHFTDTNGDALYYQTGKSGAGTQFYNTCWLNLNKVADAAPGWLPEGMSWEKGVSGASIVSATAIGSNAVAIEYSADMSNAVVRLKGDEIIGLDGLVRKDISVELDPYLFYDADGNLISASIEKVYVNSSASTVTGATHGSGSGNYIIVEFSSPLSSVPVGVIQRTTIHTGAVIASALPWRTEVR